MCESRPATSPAATRSASTPSEYLRAWRWGRWFYQRREIGSELPPSGGGYPRQAREARLSEGTLLDRPLMPLERYLQSPEAATQPAHGRREAPLGKAWAAFFELEHPMDPIPPEAFEGLPVVTTTSLQYFDKFGRPVAKGTLTRTTLLEGYEDVVCPAGRFERCARVRVDCEVRFPLILTLDWNSYVWLSAEAGEVRRVQRFSGWFLVFWFGSGHEFELDSWEPWPVPPPENPPTHWARGVVNLGGSYPGLRIEGLIIDAAPATRPGP